MITQILANMIGVFVFLFLFWKKIKEDYSSDMVFTSGLFIILGIVIGAIVTLKFFHLWWFWGAFLGSVVGILSAIFKFHLRVFETVEAAILGSLPWFTLIFWEDSIKNSSLVSLVYSFGIVGLIGLFYFLDGHYKNFTWYRSGRAGFAGLTTAGLFFLMRAAIAIFFPSVLSFVGKFEVIMSGVAAFGFFLLTFNLARKET